MTDPMTTMFGPKRCLKCGRDHYNGACPEPPTPARTVVLSPSTSLGGNLPPADPLDTSRHVDGSEDQLRRAKALYDASTNNHPTIHSNRFPSWGELSVDARNRWLREAALAQPSPLDTSGRVEGGEGE